MIRKILHLGDIHIRTFRMHDEYKETFIQLFKDIRKSIEGYERDEVRIVVAGDSVHQKIVISNEQLILGTWFLQKLEEIAPIIIIAGNHDLLENNKDRMDSVSPMVQFLYDKDVNFFKESKCYLDQNVVWCIYSIFDKNEKPDIDSARNEWGNDKTYVGIFHAPIIGAKTDIGYVIDHGTTIDLFSGCDIVLCGDIHMRQGFTFDETKLVEKDQLNDYIGFGWEIIENTSEDKVKIKKTCKIQYCGSLIQQNFGESMSGHGFLLWDVETQKFTEHDVENKYPFVQFKIKSMEDIENGTEKITNL
jgi:DNA repair exonuclease SbcCD nuclease subunit